MDMRQWCRQLYDAKQKPALPILSFPSAQLLNISVKELITSGEMQANGMKAIADRTPSAAAVSLMDLSVEAEAFGSQIRFSDDEVPTVVGRIIQNQSDADNLKVPPVGAKRTGVYIQCISHALELIHDRPVFAGIIGPYSLAGRLMDVSEIMVNCYMEPDMVHTTLDKCTDFLIQYAAAFKAAGAHGMIIAEPLTGLLSPDMASEFSAPYVKRLVSAVQDDSFAVIYHNCGNNTWRMIDAILESGADAYHFGNAVDMSVILSQMPSDILVMGNVDPAGQFRQGTPESIREATLELLEKCGGHKNFIPSSGCDIPPLAKWENIDAFFRTVEDFYAKRPIM